MKILICIILTLAVFTSFATTKEEVKEKTSAAVEATASYTKEQKEEFQRDMEVKLAAIKKEIAELRATAAEKTGKAKVEMQQQLDALEVRQEVMKKDLKKLKKSSGNAWGEMKVGMSKAWDSLSKSYKKAKDEFKESK